MERRKALAIAGGVTAVAAAAALAIGANFGLFGLATRADRVGTLRVPPSSVTTGPSAGQPGYQGAPTSAEPAPATTTAAPAPTGSSVDQPGDDGEQEHQVSGANGRPQADQAPGDHEDD